ncbi:MAG TPA: hypothetical protein VKV26_08870 [Dehalococcoidia bacterium]|nr:hypothetical protein [Dehalococcoidia bacterium]
MTTNGYTALSGTVRTVNGTGFQLQDREGWLNVSKFASLALPAVGQRVRVGLDKAGYVREIAPEAAAEAASDAPSGSPAYAAAPNALAARIAALQAATAIVGRQPGQTTVEGVLQVAAHLEAWLNR